QRSAFTHPDHGLGQSDLGSSPHRSRTCLETENSSVPPHRSEVSAGGSEGSRRQTVPSQRWMTFVRNQAQSMLACDFFVSVTVRFYSSMYCRDGDRQPTPGAFQCHLPSHCRVDLTAVSRSAGQRTGLSLCDSRSGQDLLPRPGSVSQSHGSENPQDSVPITSSEFPLPPPTRHT